MISRGSLVKTVYNTHALHTAAAATAVASSTASGPTTGAVTPTSPVSGGPPSLPATAPDSTQTAADNKRQEIDAILKQRELLAAEVKVPLMLLLLLLCHHHHHRSATAKAFFISLLSTSPLLSLQCR